MRRLSARLNMALILIGAFLFTFLNSAAISPGGRILRAGAATSNITPPLGTLRVGSFTPYPSIHVHDELHARSLVRDDGTTQIALVTVDLVGFHRSVSLEARRLILEAAALPRKMSSLRAPTLTRRVPPRALPATPTSRSSTTTSVSSRTGLPKGCGARRTCSGLSTKPNGVWMDRVLLVRPD